MIFKTRNFARWARKSGLSDALLKMAVLEIQRGLLELESLKKVAKDLLGLTAAQIAVALGEGSLVEVEHEACTT
ncbi:MAG: type II toxin-antitoxin system RelE/ParE family toxin [Pseudomonadota bacterium]